MVNILWFKDIRKGSIGTCGGKGANLGELTAAGFPVPPGFVVTSEAYFNFIRANGIDKVIKELTEGLDVQDTDRLDEVSSGGEDHMMSGRGQDLLTYFLISF